MRNKRSFSIIDAVSFGFSAFFKNIGAFLAAGLLNLGANIALAYITFLLVIAAGVSISFTELNQTFMKGITLQHPILVSIILFCAAAIYLAIFYFWRRGYYEMGLDVYDTGSTSYTRIFQQRVRDVVKYAVVFFLYGLGTALGIIALVVPGIWFATRASLCFALIVDRNLGIIESFKKSFALTYGHFFNIFGVFTVFALIGATLAFAPLYLEYTTSPLLASGAAFMSVVSQISSPLLTLIMILSTTYIYRKLAR